VWRKGTRDRRDHWQRWLGFSRRRWRRRTFNKSVEEKLDKIDILASKVDRFAFDVDLLKLKVMPNKDNEHKIVTTSNAIQVRINENIYLLY
jgi:hypothetical protein